MGAPRTFTVTIAGDVEPFATAAAIARLDLWMTNQPRRPTPIDSGPFWQIDHSAEFGWEVTLFPTNLPGDRAPSSRHHERLADAVDAVLASPDANLPALPDKDQP